MRANAVMNARLDATKHLVSDLLGQLSSVVRDELEVQLARAGRDGDRDLQAASAAVGSSAAARGADDGDEAAGPGASAVDGGGANTKVVGLPTLPLAGLLESSAAATLTPVSAEVRDRKGCGWTLLKVEEQEWRWFFYASSSSHWHWTAASMAPPMDNWWHEPVRDEGDAGAAVAQQRSGAEDYEIDSLAAVADMTRRRCSVLGLVFAALERSVARDVLELNERAAAAAQGDATAAASAPWGEESNLRARCVALWSLASFLELKTIVDPPQLVGELDSAGRVALNDVADDVIREAESVEAVWREARSRWRRSGIEGRQRNSLRWVRLLSSLQSEWRLPSLAPTPPTKAAHTVATPLEQRDHTSSRARSSGRRATAARLPDAYHKRPACGPDMAWVPTGGVTVRATMKWMETAVPATFLYDFAAADATASPAASAGGSPWQHFQTAPISHAGQLWVLYVAVKPICLGIQDEVVNAFDTEQRAVAATAALSSKKGKKKKKGKGGGSSGESGNSGATAEAAGERPSRFVVAQHGAPHLVVRSRLAVLDAGPFFISFVCFFFISFVCPHSLFTHLFFSLLIVDAGAAQCVASVSIRAGAQSADGQCDECTHHYPRVHCSETRKVNDSTKRAVPSSTSCKISPAMDVVLAIAPELRKGLAVAKQVRLSFNPSRRARRRDVLHCPPRCIRTPPSAASPAMRMPLSFAPVVSACSRFLVPSFHRTTLRTCSFFLSSASPD